MSWTETALRVGEWVTASGAGAFFMWLKGRREAEADEHEADRDLEKAQIAAELDEDAGLREALQLAFQRIRELTQRVDELGGRVEQRDKVILQLRRLRIRDHGRIEECQRDRESLRKSVESLEARLEALERGE